MKLKQSKSIGSFQNIKKSFFKAKWKVFCLVLIITLFSILGCISGIILVGALDYSSQDIRDELFKLGISDELRSFGNILKGIAHEHVKIPIDYLRNQFIKTDKMHIDIKFENFQKIVYKRQQALEEGALFASSEDYVPAKISYDGKEYKVEVRLKGDWADHWQGDKWSFRIKVKGGDKILGMERFSIQNPKTRNGVNEWIYMNALRSQGLIGLRYKFIEIIINGENKGIYALEEHFSKELIESNRFKEGPILRLNEDALFLNSILNNKKINDSYLFSKSSVEAFDNYKDIIESEVLTEQFIEGTGLLISLKKGDLHPHEVVDSNQFAKYYAIGTLLTCPHSDRWHNMRFYYNPVTSLLEPIGFDGECEIGQENGLSYYLPDKIVLPNESNINYINQPVDLQKIILSDKIIFEKYIHELERLLEKQVFDSLIEEISEDLEINIRTIKKDNPFYFFDETKLGNIRIELLKELEEPMAINAYFESKLDGIKLKIESSSKFPLEIIGIEYKDEILPTKKFILLQPEKTILPSPLIDVIFGSSKNYSMENLDTSQLKVRYKILGSEKIFTREVYPWKNPSEEFINQSFMRQKYNLSEANFLEIDNQNKIIMFKSGEIEIKTSIFLPGGFKVMISPGTKIDLLNESTIISYSNIFLDGNPEAKILITSSDGTGQGMSIIGPLNKSIISHTIFSNLFNPHKNNWQLPGAINFYETEISLDNVIFEDIKSEDALNLVRTKFDIKNSTFLNSSSDCFDSDFGEGEVISTKFINCGNDGLDFSGSNVKLEGIEILNAGDKGISAGEISNITAKNITIKGEATYIAIASKDTSFVNITNATINGPKYGLAVYRKKLEYGPASIWANEITFSMIKNVYIVEQKSKINLNKAILLDSKKDVYELLYGE